MDLPDIGRYRRRFIVEFGPEDSGLVDRVGEVYDNVTVFDDGSQTYGSAACCSLAPWVQH
jgi:hypothetical protein